MGITTNSNDGPKIDVTQLLLSVADAYGRMPMPVRRYAMVVLAPATLFFVVTVVLAVFLPLALLVRLPIAFLGVLAFAAAFLYPKLLVEQERMALERQLHIVITHMTVLSTTKIDRVEVFRQLANEEEYGRLAAEMGRVVLLVDAWNQSLDEACQRRARAVPSKPLADFFDRMAYSLNAGQDIGDFLLGEQNAVVQRYVTVYEGTLENLEVMKDLYLSMILSMTFALVNAIVLPILTGTDAALVVAVVIVVFVMVQLGFYYVIRSMTPYDPVWYRQKEYTMRSDLVLAGSTYGAFALSVLIVAFGAVAVLVGGGLKQAVLSLPLPVLMAIPVTPLIVPGIIIRRMENRVNAVDNEFPSFIRALGSSETAKQSTTTAVLRTLRKKDFGDLSQYVDRLFTRLSMRLNQEKSWYFFAAETRSYLIQKFSEMYLVGRGMGGEPKVLGELISRNMNEILQLRERRKQSTVTLIGVLYGLTAASTFAFFMGLEVTIILAEMSSNLNLGESFSVGKFLYGEVYDVGAINYLLTMTLLFNAALSSLTIRLVDGGHKANAFFHFVILVWLSALLAVATRSVVGAML